MSVSSLSFPFDEENFYTWASQAFTYLSDGELRAVAGANILWDATENRHYHRIVSDAPKSRILVLIKQWRREYNQARRHSAKNYCPLPPEAILPMT